MFSTFTLASSFPTRIQTPPSTQNIKADRAEAISNTEVELLLHQAQANSDPKSQSQAWRNVQWSLANRVRHLQDLGYSLDDAANRVRQTAPQDHRFLNALEQAKKELQGEAPTTRAVEQKIFMMQLAQADVAATVGTSYATATKQKLAQAQKDFKTALAASLADTSTQISATSKHTQTSDANTQTRTPYEDPINQAALALGQRHTDTFYLNTLTACAKELRLQQSRTQVDALMEQGQQNAALQSLKTQMDASSNIEERAQVFTTAGSAFFSDDALTYSFSQAKEKSPNWLRDIVDHAPKEIVDRAIDIALRDSKSLMRLRPANEMTALYASFSHAAKITPSYAKKISQWYLQQGNSSGTVNPTLIPFAFPLASIGQAIAEGNGTELAVALANECATTNLAARNLILEQIAQGLKMLNDKTEAASGRLNGNAKHPGSANDLKFYLTNFADSSDPEGVSKIISNYRAAHPNIASNIDTDTIELSKWSAETYLAAQGLNTLQMPNAPTTSGERSIDAILATYAKSQTLQTSLSNNIFLAQQLMVKAKYETPMAADGIEVLNWWAHLGRHLCNLTRLALPLYGNAEVAALLASGGDQSKIDRFLSRMEQLALRNGLDSNEVTALKQATNTWQSEIKATLDNPKLDTSDKANRITALNKGLEESFAKLGKLSDVFIARWADYLKLGNWAFLSHAATDWKILFEGRGTLSVEAYTTGQTPSAARGPITSTVAALTGKNLEALRFVSFFAGAGAFVVALGDLVLTNEQWKDGNYVRAMNLGMAIGGGLDGAATLLRIFGYTVASGFNLVGMTILGIAMVLKMSYNIYTHNKLVNANESDHNPRLDNMLIDNWQLAKAQTRELLNNNKNGLNAMHILKRMPGVAMSQIKQWMKIHTPAEIADIVREAHYVLDHHLDKHTGEIPLHDIATDAQVGNWVSKQVMTTAGKGGGRMMEQRSMVHPQSAQGLLNYMQKKYGPLPAALNKVPDSSATQTIPPQGNISIAQPTGKLISFYIHPKKGQGLWQIAAENASVLLANEAPAPGTLSETEQTARAVRKLAILNPHKSGKKLPSLTHDNDIYYLGPQLSE